MGISFGILSQASFGKKEASAITYHSIFVDINGDGKLDYVKYAEVVLNQDTNLANPASIYCVQQGGAEKIITDKDGNQSGLCVFPDGSQCDEWAYYRGECMPSPLPDSP
jgi:putative hemolysin